MLIDNNIMIDSTEDVSSGLTARHKHVTSHTTGNGIEFNLASETFIFLKPQPRWLLYDAREIATAISRNAMISDGLLYSRIGGTESIPFSNFLAARCKFPRDFFENFFMYS